MYQKMLLSEKIVENITDLIVKGYYKPGDKLPNELDMSSELGISRASLREAFKILESRNIIEVKRGIGTFIASMPGLSDDPLGSRFINEETNKNDSLRIIAFIGGMLIEKSEYLDVQGRQHLEAALKRAEQWQTPTAAERYLHVLEVLNEIAILTESDYLRRLWRIHTLTAERLFKGKSVTADEYFLGFYSQFKQALQNQDISAASAAFKGIVDTLR
ncbi:MAG: GntR family transcriptional regulator, transcriptional repressor for pyruvate dehydrogenase complex [Clostridiales bacterium]|jgi:DNA-binding FadR family transcriptional regulator|nr:GntR family transcriptional regulator, transcriptional repressor for pyruvate dehydrogenase complex [Clostridiales bacterium]MDN5297822.1 GntR family transcriptional regulator, transcriptional repressor for pyruvate dehydrogenase complex [Clostridiales bacterium]